MATVNSKISLSLAEKLRIIFEKDDKYLVFPSGVGFGYKELVFMQDLSSSGLSALEQSNFKGQFARLLNIIPDDNPLYSADATLSLWNRTVDIVKDSVFAVSALSSTEETRLTEAINFLTDQQVQGDGTSIPVNSVQVNRYYEFKVKYETLASDYVDAKTTAESATGPGSDKIKQDWTTSVEKQLKALVNQAEQEWKNLGFKDLVENYQAVRNDLEVKKYLLHYKYSYLNEISLAEIRDPANQGLGAYLTYFSPYDVFNKNMSWPSITLTKQEVDTLVQKASNTYKTIFPPGSVNEDFESVTIEYNNVTIMKPWFKPEFFASRYWKLPESKLVSDGGTPRKGLIPAYITSMIVVRSIKIVRKKDTPSKQIFLPIISTFSLDLLKGSGAIQNNADIIQRKKVMKFAPPIFKVEDIRLQDNKRLNLADSIKRVNTISAIPVKPMNPFVVGNLANINTVRSGSTMMMNPNLVASTIVKNPVSPEKYTQVKYIGTAIKMPAYIGTTKTSANTNTSNSTELVTEIFPFDGVMVIAYVCKRIPKSPIPDESLQW